ncbi:2-oxo acid dehydrogenase subunit E2 [Streptacidiphilus sp. ASG 303]|uniref:dihydrolipoamide acetyltransferase family protein n=1 Tax=Streptacidiphilus sp. ASG 303 TaxID=2896847 RepID=UPI001E4F8221|nr:dihydrolipoamide acetyltransferase family protein [Streptacidiphilus sp. ASG 303]MCD0482261.1 2-oxo acid dehydrogenase subunit E2 [Streptacidiphilus sp. ASG 303]
MPVVREFTLPDLGEGLTGAEIIRWMVEVGEVVAVDQPVVEVETAKASVEVPCPYGGVVTARFGEPGEEVPVGAPLVTVAVAAPEGGSSSPSANGSSGSGSSGSGSGANGSGNVLVGYGTAGGHGGPRRRRVRPAAPAAPVRTAALPAPAPAAPPAAPARSGPVPVISPLVRRTAREHGIDLATLTGSGPDGLILRADVARAVAAAQSPAAPAASGPASASGDGDEVVPLRGLRRTVAEKLSRSRREIPDATCWVDADATELLALKDRLATGAGPRIGLLPLLARICTAALARHPDLNASVVTDPDGTPTAIRRHRAVHLGFAAQTGRGLVVPVVRDAHRMTTEQLAAEMARLTAAAREGTLTPAELTGGTFTLNNYGVFGVDGSTPIVNHPEAAMLGVGRVAAKPWVHGGELAVRQVTQLSFTFDHRVCDGGTAGGFLRFVADCVEQPGELLRHL